MYTKSINSTTTKKKKVMDQFILELAARVKVQKENIEPKEKKENTEPKEQTESNKGGTGRGRGRNRRAKKKGPGRGKTVGTGFNEQKYNDRVQQNMNKCTAEQKRFITHFSTKCNIAIPIYSGTFTSGKLNNVFEVCYVLHKLRRIKNEKFIPWVTNKYKFKTPDLKNMVITLDLGPTNKPKEVLAGMIKKCFDDSNLWLIGNADDDLANYYPPRNDNRSVVAEDLINWPSSWNS